MSDNKIINKIKEYDLKNQSKRRREVRWSGPAGSVFITYEYY